MASINSAQLDNLIFDALSIEHESALEAGTLGFMARVLVQVTLPHSNPNNHIFERVNGSYKMIMMSYPSMGLPYGTLPRLLLAWLSSEAIKTNSRELELGTSMAAFMRELGMASTGGANGTVIRLKEQIKRLFSTRITCVNDHEDYFINKNFDIASSANVWWTPKDPNNEKEWRSSVVLNETFFNELIDRPVPLDLRALQALKRSPMALDIYAWLTYRMSYLKKTTNIPWKLLQLQFGAEYSQTRIFKRKFLDHLKKVIVVYPALRVYGQDKGLLLMPSPTHIKMK